MDVPWSCLIILDLFHLFELCVEWIWLFDLLCVSTSNHKVQTSEVQTAHVVDIGRLSFSMFQHVFRPKFVTLRGPRAVNVQIHRPFQRATWSSWIGEVKPFLSTPWDIGRRKSHVMWYGSDLFNNSYPTSYQKQFSLLSLLSNFEFSQRNHRLLQHHVCNCLYMFAISCNASWPFRSFSKSKQHRCGFGFLGFPRSEEGWHCAPGFVGHVAELQFKVNDLNISRYKMASAGLYICFNKNSRSHDMPWPWPTFAFSILFFFFLFNQRSRAARLWKAATQPELALQLPSFGAVPKCRVVCPWRPGRWMLWMLLAHISSILFLSFLV